MSYAEDALPPENQPARKRRVRLFDALNFNPEWPEHATQPARLLSQLIRSRAIGPREGLNELGIYRLSDTVFQLREAGWPVITNRVDVLNQFGEKCFVASYTLPDWCIDRVGEAGLEFAYEEKLLMVERRTSAWRA